MQFTSVSQILPLEFTFILFFWVRERILWQESMDDLLVVRSTWGFELKCEISVHSCSKGKLHFLTYNFNYSLEGSYYRRTECIIKGHFTFRILDDFQANQIAFLKIKQQNKLKTRQLYQHLNFCFHNINKYESEYSNWLLSAHLKAKKSAKWWFSDSLAQAERAKIWLMPEKLETIKWN